MKLFRSFLLTVVAGVIILESAALAKEDGQKTPKTDASPEANAEAGKVKEQDAPSEEARAVVDSVSQKTDTIMKSSDKDSEKIEKLLQLFQNHFNVPAIARFVLGKHWKKATQQQKVDYVTLFAKDIAVTYYNLLKKHYRNKLEVTKVEKKASEGDMEIYNVFSKAVGATQEVTICWQLMNKKILDVLVDGASMVFAQRQDYAQMVRDKQGLEGFLEWLKQKVDRQILSEKGN